MSTYLTLFLTYLKLGCTSFGGPVAHIGYFRDEFIQKKQWLSDSDYADILALCHFLPGPGSSQVGLSLGFKHAAYWGGFLAWLGFTLPSALLMIIAAVGFVHFNEHVPHSIIQGLKIVAVAVVGIAVWKMYQKLCQGILKTSMMLIAALTVVFLASYLNMALLQILIIIVAGVIGYFCLNEPSFESKSIPTNSSQSTSNRANIAWIFLLIFFLLLLVLPILANQSDQAYFQAFASFYKTGSLVFGGGHVVLPLLETETVAKGLIDKDTFLAGYGLAQAVPGPLFSFAAFLGGSIFSATTQSLWLGALLCLFAIYLPSFLLIFGLLPYWDTVRQSQKIKAAFAGINAAVVGLLLAALYDPIWTNAIYGIKEFAIVVGSLLALTVLRIPTWLVVLLTALVAWVLL